MTFRRVLRVVLVLAACLSVAPPAHAYLDPGTGRMILSAVIGLAVAVSLALKMFWYRGVGWLRGVRRQLRRRPAEGAPVADE